MLFKQDPKVLERKEKTELQQQFYRLMFELGLGNKYNRTYFLSSMEKTSYGYSAKIYLEPGLSFTELQKHVGTIQENLKCLWVMKTVHLQEYATVQIVTKEMDKFIPYENPGIRPWELYMGLNFAMEVIKNNNNECCMFLLAGATGTGKTRFIYMILLSWILGCRINEVEIYLSDIAKDEYPHFQYVKHVRSYARDLEQLTKMVRYLEIVIERRKKIISQAREEGWATNIEEYNKKSKSKMSYCYIIIDEASVIIPDKTDSEAEKEQKQLVLDVLKKISKIGRSLGIFCLIATQKTTREEMPAIIKNMSAVRISFRANDLVSSEVIIGDNSAVGLSDRYAVYSLNGGDKKDYLYSPYLTTELLKELLKPHTDRVFRKVDLDAEISAAKEKAPLPPVTARKVKTHAHEIIDISARYPADFIKVVGGDIIDY